jgi:hypothetical protein
LVWLGSEPASLTITGIPGEYQSAKCPNELGLASLERLFPGASAVVVPQDDCEAALVGADLAA